ncbi:MAG: hypothetical protein ACWGMZ_06770, partial [Thermoguttaceae bacterium]
MSDDFRLQCPIPLSDYPTVQMAHGGGGRLMRQLIETMFRPTFSPRTANGGTFIPGACAGRAVE